MKNYGEEVFGSVVRGIDKENPSEDLRELADQLLVIEDLDVEHLHSLLVTIANTIENREESLLELSEEHIVDLVTDLLNDDVWFQEKAENICVESIAELFEMEGEIIWEWAIPDDSPCPSCGLSECDKSFFTQRIMQLGMEIRQLKEDQLNLAALNAELISRVRHGPKRTSKTYDER